MSTPNRDPYTTVISAPALAEANPNCVILDCRARLGDPAWGASAHAQQHLPRALHADLDTQLAAPPGAGGRHPLPSKSSWIDCIRRWGIGNEDQVVVYDDAGGAFAARAWWMLRWVGHERVAVLDGGMDAWAAATDSNFAQGQVATPTPSEFAQGTPLTEYIDSPSMVEAVNKSASSRLIDARTEARWAGKEEPIDPVAGHIPGALCRPFQLNLDGNGHFKSAVALHKEFAELLGGNAAAPVICYCGSGVTAAHNVLAMRIAGFDEPTLYADSWSGWITDPSRPIATDLTPPRDE